MAQHETFVSVSTRVDGEVNFAAEAAQARGNAEACKGRIATFLAIIATRALAVKQVR
jgi:hypothetical protein